MFNIDASKISIGVPFVFYTWECIWGRDLIMIHEKLLQILGVRKGIWVCRWMHRPKLKYKYLSRDT